MRRDDFGVQFYDGPSLLTGDRVVGILTGLHKGSANRKTGRMAQAWVIRPDRSPADAKRANLDDAVCGSCKLRGRDGQNSGCYVPGFWPGNVYQAYRRGVYPAVSWGELQAVVEGRVLRLCAYGDPAAIGFDVWQTMLATAAGWVGYTHAWQTCDPRLQAICMASVDDQHEFIKARWRGWRTFRIRRTAEDAVFAGAEFLCPASDEMQHRTTCDRCQLCRGKASPARNVVIVAHGKPSSLKAFGIHVPFFKSREQAVSA